MKVTTDACLFGAWVGEKERSDPEMILDIGTGTGLLTLMLAQCLRAKIDAIEVDETASLQAGENFRASPWANRISVYNQDIQQFNPKLKYDVVLSNPPFYENELASGDPRKNLAMHEGLSLPELVNVIKKNINPEGSFYLLLPFKRHEEIRTLLLKNDIQIQNLCFVRQSTRHEYFRIILKGRLALQLPQMTEIEEIAIMDEMNRYTPEFERLLKDYYLNL
jgi:tRNA1Val (adenine37-N6)-methyltransferase